MNDWGRATRRGLLWSTASFLAGRTLTFLSVVVLARLLTPADFGVVAAAIVFLTMVEVISDVGMKATVVYEQEQGITDRVQTAFTTNLIVAATLTGAGVLFAPLIARFFEMENHVDIFRLASLSLLLSGLGNVHDSLLLRELDFRRRLVPDLARGVTRGVLSIALALAGFGAEALVIGMLAGTAAWTASQWIITPFRPNLTFNGRIARSMAGYGSGAAVLNVAASIVGSVQIGTIGKALGAQALGLYTVARRVPELAIETVAFNVSRVSFPALARKRATDREGLNAATLAILRYQALYAAPAAVGLGILATPLIVVLFSTKWREAATVLPAVATLSGVGSVAFPLGDVLKAVGKQWFLVVLNIVQIPLVATGIVLLAPHGIVAVSWLLAATTVAFATGVTAIAMRELRIPVRGVVSAARPGLIAAAGVALGAGGVRVAWPAASAGALVAGILAAAAGGLLSLRLLQPGVLGEVSTAFGLHDSALGRLRRGAVRAASRR